MREPSRRRRTGLGEGLRERARVPTSSIEEAWGRPRSVRRTQKKKKSYKLKLDFQKLPIAKVKSSLKKRAKKGLQSSVQHAKKIQSSRTHKGSKTYTKRLNVFVLDHKRSIILVAVVFLSPVLLIAIIKGLSAGDSKPQLLGDQSGSSDFSSGKLEVVDTTEFELLKPNNPDTKLNVVKISPAGNDPTYAYIDTVSGTEVRVSQQKMPESFVGDVDAKLEELAKSFQATNIIQIDEQKVFHGYSEKGKTQSLIFIKKDILIFIASPIQLSDDQWVGYVRGLH